VVYEKDMGSLPKGEHEFVWNGADAQGNVAADGQYTFEVTATDSKGNNVAGTLTSYGIVTAVRFRDGMVYLVVNNVEIPVSDIKEILYDASSII
jgi:flagellar basal-body rod modification protein FlgD